MSALPSEDDWIVLKFGGTSVSRRPRWDNIGRLMAARAREEQCRVLVVVSALSGVTNDLQALADRGHDDAAAAAAVAAARPSMAASARRTMRDGGVWTIRWATKELCHRHQTGLAYLGLKGL